MGNLTHAESFRDLIVYRKSRDVAREVFVLTRGFPKDEMYSLTDQVRRSSRSVGAQICEAWAKRRYEKLFVSKLTDADGEQQETQHWIECACDCGYITNDIADGLCERLAEIGRMLNSMMEKSDQFCGAITRTLRESAGEYFVSTDD